MEPVRRIGGAAGAQAAWQAWIIGVGAACACLLPASNVLCEKLTERPLAIVPVLCGIICVAIMVQLGADQSYEFIYFRF